jgi:hypothetical protein
MVPIFFLGYSKLLQTLIFPLGHERLVELLMSHSVLLQEETNVGVGFHQRFLAHQNFDFLLK